MPAKRHRAVEDLQPRATAGRLRKRKGLLRRSPDAGAIALVAAAVVTGIIDGAGNLPFLRAVHPWERPEMTTVFSTYRDMALLAPPGIFAVLLKVFALPAVFVASASFMVVLAVLSRYLPRRF